MKAAQINNYSNDIDIRINTVETPQAGADDVVVEVHASSLNPFDTTIRTGAMKDVFPVEFPFTLGGDIAGIVAYVGTNVVHVRIGDKVYGQANVVAGNSGAFAEFARTKASQVAKAPSNLDFASTASLPLVGVSALQALMHHIKLASGQKIFIHGGAGGIGSVAIQIAKNIGAHVATTATGENIDLVRQLGADEVIDFKSQDFVAVLKDFDAVFDTVGGSDFQKSFGILKSGSIAVTMIAEFNDDEAKQKGITAIRQGTKVVTESLDQLRLLVEAGTVTPRVGKTFPLDKIVEAFKARESGAVNGKIVLQIK
jgi:alcohol dehydrogenase